uniref:Uncharacterized protein n=1 Tax=Anguilla anguilla TaxID=7936 RepID=A0A0E9QR50_ANGAN
MCRFSKSQSLAVVNGKSYDLHPYIVLNQMNNFASRTRTTTPTI